MSKQDASNQDFEAAMHEVDSNLEVRRLMLVLTNVLTPACVMAASDSLSGSTYTDTLRWLPPAILPIVGGLLLVSGFLVTGVVARCHFGLVLNGTKMRKVERGTLDLRSLNWLGVTTNFLLLTALSSGLGAMTLFAGFGCETIAWVAAIVTAAAVMFWLPVTHRRANARCQQLDADWQHGELTEELRLEHTRKSLDGTAADISVVVVMAAALFAGVFSALTNLGAIPDELVVTPTPSTLKAIAPGVLLVYLLLSLMLSCRILVRLRLAFGAHSQRLAKLRGEQDSTAMKWRPQERTYLLYAIVLTLAVASAIMLGFELSGAASGAALGTLLLIAGGFWYPLRLLAERRRRERDAQAT